MLLMYPRASLCLKDVLCGMRSGFNKVAVLLEGNKSLKKRCQL